ncbi:unnamed protein product, partial [marine sediment metagenome]
TNTNWIYNLPIVDFNYIGGSNSQTGGIAEDWELIDERLISYKRNITYKQECIDEIDFDTNETYWDCWDVIDKIETTDIPETINYGSPILISSMLKEMQEMKNIINLTNGARIWDDADCLYLSSPDGSTTQRVCNQGAEL